MYIPLEVEAKIGAHRSEFGVDLHLKPRLSSHFSQYLLRVLVMSLLSCPDEMLDRIAKETALMGQRDAEFYSRPLGTPTHQLRNTPSYVEALANANARLRHICLPLLFCSVQVELVDEYDLSDGEDLFEHLLVLCKLRPSIARLIRYAPQTRVHATAQK